MAFKLRSQEAVKAGGFKMMGSSSPLKDQDDRKHTHEDGQKWFERKTVTNEDGSTSWTQQGVEGSSDENEAAIAVEAKRKRSGGKSYQKAWNAMSPEDQEAAGGFGNWYKDAVAWNKSQIEESETTTGGGESTINPLERSGSTPAPEEVPEDPDGGVTTSSGGGGGGGKKRKKKRKKWNINFGGSNSGSSCGPGENCSDNW